MKPIYHPNFVQEPQALLDHLMGLEWLNLTEARLEYFMSTEPRSFRLNSCLRYLGLD